MKTPAVPGLFVETLLILPVALVFIVWMVGNQEVSFLKTDWTTDTLLILGGLVTVVPLALFTAGARILPMTTAGILFFITPSLQFLIGYLHFNEPFNNNQFIGFIGIWVGLLLYCYDLMKKT